MPSACVPSPCARPASLLRVAHVVVAVEGVGVEAGRQTVRDGHRVAAVGQTGEAVVAGGIGDVDRVGRVVGGAFDAVEAEPDQGDLDVLVAGIGRVVDTMSR